MKSVLANPSASRLGFIGSVLLKPKKSYSYSIGKMSKAAIYMRNPKKIDAFAGTASANKGIIRMIY